MGPASISGQDALSALSDVVTTEGGQHFVAADGRIVFQSRGDRYSSMLPAYTFGDGPGEHRYEEVDFDFDPTHLGNDIQVTQASTGQVFTAEDTASQAAYFPRMLTRTVNVSDPYEAQSAAQYLRSRYAQPQFRVETMVLSPASNPALWSVALALELGMRIRVIRRPLGRSPISVDMFVQSLSWSIDGNGAAKLTVQAAPVDLTPYGSFAAWHSTTKAAYPIGTTGIAVAPVAGDSNLLAALIAPGQQLTIEPGTANAETLTVDHCNTTAPGWTSGTIVMTSTTTKAHPLGAVICEALPGSVTDPTTWDSVSKFDQEAFVY
jgi:hypothetical protein